MINKPHAHPAPVEDLAPFVVTDETRLTATRGAQFRAVHRLSTADNVTLADVGATCEAVPDESLDALLAAGHIEPVEVDHG